MREQSNVVALSASSRSSSAAQRAHALFGPTPMFTFSADGAEPDICCSVRLIPGGPETWLGLLDDKAGLTDRIRLAGGEMQPRFVVHLNADTTTVCGEATVRLLGNVGRDGELPAQLPSSLAGAAARLVTEAAFGAAGSVLVEVCPGAVRVDEDEAPAHGAVPRT